MSSQAPGPDEVGAANILEARRLYEEYRKRYGQGAPTGADTAIQAATALERAVQAPIVAAGQATGPLFHAMGAPGRAVAAIGTNLSTAQPVSVVDAALYGQDLETGSRPVTYGSALAGTLEESGEVAKGGIASRLIQAAGDMVTDPAMAPLLLSGAEAAGSLMGRATPSVNPVGPGRGPRMPPRGTLHPTSRPIPPGPAPNGYTNWGGLKLNPNMPPIRAGGRFNPAATQPVQISPEATQPVPRFDPNATQPVRGVARVGGELPPTETQPVRIVKPKAPKGSGGIEKRFAQERANVKGAAAKSGPKKGSGSPKNIEDQAGRAGMTKKGGTAKPRQTIEEKFAEQKKNAKDAKGKTWKPRTKKGGEYDPGSEKYVEPKRIFDTKKGRWIDNPKWKPKQ